MLNKYHNNLLNIFVLVVILLFTASQSQATVNESFVVDDLRYTILTEEGATGTVAVKGNNKNISGDLSIPSSVENNSITYSVNRIGWGGFVGYTNLTSVLIPDSVTAIEMEAFYNCVNLSNIVIPDSVTGIGDNAFARCYSLS
ncbi:MAG: leucine-rich repeat protein, partial [Verrucomicrobia bacterium]|nr:leucine-rich repeat protein [Verrucomicrobiota bacterium]